jgi:hypothetical protein
VVLILADFAWFSSFVAEETIQTKERGETRRRRRRHQHQSGHLTHLMSRSHSQARMTMSR